MYNNFLGLVNLILLLLTQKELRKAIQKIFFKKNSQNSIHTTIIVRYAAAQAWLREH